MFLRLFRRPFILKLAFTACILLLGPVYTYGKNNHDVTNRILIVNTNLHDYELNGYDSLKEKIEGVVPNAAVYILHYEKVTRETIDAFGPIAIILGGQGTPWTCYPRQKLERICALIRRLNLPLLGICGGHQLIAISYGASASPVLVLDKSKHGYDGSWRENGFTRVKIIDTGDPVFAGMNNEVSVYENHCDEVRDLPADFILIAGGNKCKIQAMKLNNKPVYGVQFHPEFYNSDNAAGKLVLRQFFSKICGVEIFQD